MRPHRSLAAAALVLFILASACAGETGGATGAQAPAASFPVKITDDDGVTVRIEAEPQRIVTFAPSMTEIVFALGLGERLVGVAGDFDDYPPEATTIERVGGAGDFGVDPNIERVVALEPDLFLTIAGGEHWKEQLRKLDLPVVTLNATNVEDLLSDIETVGRLTGASEDAERLVTAMRLRADSVADLAAGSAVPCFFEVYYPPLTTVGPDTFVFDLLERAGCDPVSGSAETDYPEWSVEKLVEDGPDVYLLTDDTGVTPEDVAARPGFDAIPAIAAGNVEVVDGDLVTRPGPRVVDGLEALARLLHPDGG